MPMPLPGILQLLTFIWETVGSWVLEVEEINAGPTKAQGDITDSESREAAGLWPFPKCRR